MKRTARDTPQRRSAIRTFLIADIRGYTRFTNELGDEAGSRLAAKFAQVTAEGVEAYDGTLLELRGDEALCVFDSARAALRCAVDLQDAYVDETRAEPHLPLTVGIGLDAGEAVPLGDGYRGAALNLAARLCSAAEAGAAMATEGLVHLAGRIDGLAYAALDGRPLKGFDEPVAAWLIRSAETHEHDVEGAPLTEPGPLPPELDAVVPLVGRDADLRWLRWHWRRARHGHGSVVAIAGPHGMGRTRLAAELAAIAHSDRAHVRYLRSDSELTGVGRPALIVVDDAETIPAARAREMWRALAVDPERQLVVITHVDPVPEPIARQLGRVVSEERRRSLRSLLPDAVAEIARLYLERPGDEPPSQLLFEESDGVPAAVHRVASQWARAAAARRLGESARRTSRERRDLRAAEAELIGDVATLEYARERSRLYVEAPADQGAGAISVCPYKGLAAFEAVDAEYYYGRERLVAELIARIVGSAFVGLVGASGSGKSSALQAGLLPELAHGVLPGSDHWIQVSMRPGDHPLLELEAALRRVAPERVAGTGDPRASLATLIDVMAPTQRTLLVIDQFEEIFTGADETERSDFVDLITEPRAGLKVLVAVRADHYERCAAYPRLARALGGDQVLVGPLSTTEIEAIIRHPGERVGLRVEPELVEALVADIGTEPGGLPLLSTALLELWEARDGGRLTLAAYHATGGVRGAVARMAESAYQRLDEERQAAARGIFLRLAGEGGAGSVVRRRVRAEELGATDRAAVADAVRDLTAARLLTASDGYVEVAHEALLREWPRLRAWIDDDDAGRQLRLHLMAAARTWEEGGREDGDLYRAARLASVLDWSAEHLLELNVTERSFIEQSRTASEGEAERQRRTNRILRGLLAGAAAFLLIAIGAGAFAAVQAQRADAERRNAVAEADRAEREAQRAEEQETLARSRELAQSAIAVLEQDPELSMQLAVEAAEIGGDLVPEAVTALHRAIQASRAVVHLAIPFEEGKPRPDGLGVELSADGSRMFVARNSRSIEIYDVDSRRLVRTLGVAQPDTETHILALSVLHDQQRAAIVDEDAVVHIWSLDDGSEQTLQGPGYGTPSRPSFSPDGRLMAVATFATRDRDPGRMMVTVWDLQTEEELVRLDDARLGELGLFDVQVRFHPDGQRVLLAPCDCDPIAGLRWLDVATGEVSEAFVEGVPINGVAISPDGTLIATGDAERTVKLWDAESGLLVRTFRGHHDVILSVTFSSDGRRLASTAGDEVTRVWDVHSGGDPSGIGLLELAGQYGGIWSASFSSDGSRLATGGPETVRIWDISRERAAEVAGLDIGWARVMSLHAEGGLAAALGRTCSAGFCFGATAILDLESGELVELLDGVSGVGIGLSPDGTGVIAQVGVPGADITARGPETFERIRRYSTATGAVELELEEICAHSFPAPGEVGCGVPPAIPWDEQMVSVAFSADGSLMAIAGNSPAVSLWDAASGEFLGLVRLNWLDPGRFPGFGLALSADGSYLAVSSIARGVFILRTDAVTGADAPRLEALDAEMQELEDGLAVATDSQREATLDRQQVLLQQFAYVLGVVHRLDVEAWAIEFSPGGDAVAIGSPQGSRVYSLETGQSRYELLPSWGLDLSADGSRLITIDSDGAARLWDFDSGRELQLIPAITEGLGDAEGAIQFAENEDHIVVVDAGTLKVLTVDVEELISIARSRFTRPLTDDECRKYLHLDSCAVMPSDAPGDR
jgi:WD40 repeat protein/class 3 adenylate cyclase/energy-coupling factor transporter ATP-binding protein EcfA2